MANHKPTPGPWCLGEPYSVKEGKYALRAVSVSAHGQAIARVWLGPDDPPRAGFGNERANARLIAGARTMYDALDEADTAFAVLNISSEELTPQARAAHGRAWVAVQAALGVVHGPDSVHAQAARANAARVPAMRDSEAKLAAILDELDSLGLGDDETINGADAVDYLNELRRSLAAFLNRNVSAGDA